MRIGRLLESLSCYCPCKSPKKSSSFSETMDGGSCKRTWEDREREDLELYEASVLSRSISYERYFPVGSILNCMKICIIVRVIVFLIILFVSPIRNQSNYQIRLIRLNTDSFSESFVFI